MHETYLDASLVTALKRFKVDKILIFSTFAIFVIMKKKETKHMPDHDRVDWAL